MILLPPKTPFTLNGIMLFALLSYTPACSVGVGDPARSEIGSKTRFDLSFAGGTAQEFIAALEQSYGQEINSIIPQRLAANPVIRPVNLTDVTVETVFSALNELHGENIGNWAQVENVWILKEELESAALYVGHLRAKLSYVAIAEAIHDSLRTTGDRVYLTGGGGGGPGGPTSWRWGDQLVPFCEIRYHPNAQALSIIGTPSHIQLAKDLVREIGKGMNLPDKSIMPTN